MPETHDTVIVGGGHLTTPTGKEPMEIASWLTSLGLERYLPAFEENEIDLSVLPRLTADDLKDMGVVVVGHRRKLLEAIAELKSPSPPHETPVRTNTL